MLIAMQFAAGAQEVCMQVAGSSKGDQKQLWLLAACERLQRHLGQSAGALNAIWQSAAEALGSELGLQPADVAVFGEEVCCLIKSVLFISSIAMLS